VKSFPSARRYRVEAGATSRRGWKCFSCILRGLVNRENRRSPLLSERRSSRMSATYSPSFKLGRGPTPWPSAFRRGLITLDSRGLSPTCGYPSIGGCFLCALGSKGSKLLPRLHASAECGDVAIADRSANDLE